MTTILTGPSNNLDPPPVSLRRFSVAEYHRLGEVGVLTEQDRVELIEGWIVNKMNRNPQHDWCLHQCLSIWQKYLPAEFLIRIQSASTTSDSEPEPDLAIVTGPAERYRQTRPAAADVQLVIEVSESSLRYDQTVKSRVYARAGIPAYWVINLVQRQIELYGRPSTTEPASYLDRTVLTASDTLSLTVAGAQHGRIVVSDLVP